MNYQCEVMINATLERVVNLLLDHEKMMYWHEDLVEVVPVEQEENSFLLIYKVGKERYAMKEIIKLENLPESLIYRYEVPGAIKEDKFLFVEDNGKTLWINDVNVEFEKPLNIPKEAFNKKTLNDMQRFKDFVEQHT
ncbi:MAG: hypothetical protein ACLFRI_07715 [Candidatus Izemoplasmataceae bacterium]